MDPDYILMKPYFVLLYGVFGTTCLCLASGQSHRFVASTYRIARVPVFAAVLAIIAALLLLVRYSFTSGLLLIGAATVAIVIFAADPRNRTLPLMIAALTTILIVLSLAWWRMWFSTLEPLPLSAFAVTLIGLMHGLTDPGQKRLRSPLIPIGVSAVVGLLLLVDLGAFQPGSLALFTLIHHWGAFTGPALQVKAGLVPLYDVPLQYGLGPTLAVAAVCHGSDCWTGAQAVFAGATLAVGSLLLAMALASKIPRGWAWSCAVTGTVFAAVFLWPGYPADGTMLAATPSIGGIRFLPLTLVAALLFFGRRTAATAAMIPAVLWSPESAAMSVAVYGLCSTSQFGVLKATAVTSALLVGSYAALFLIHRLVYGVFIDPAVFYEYVLHVPGALPIDPVSDMVLLACALGLGGWLMLHPADDAAEARRDLIATALLFAAGSYCLGRSHPNNVCDLAPFLVLVPLRILERPVARHERLRRVTAFGLAAAVATLALSPWNSVPFDRRALTDIHAVVAKSDSFEPAIARIRSGISDTAGLGIADFGPLLARHPTETIVWTPMDPSSLWSYVPSERRQLYIRRSEARLRRAGWAIFAENQFFLFEDLRTAYDVSNEQDFIGEPIKVGGLPGHYRLACFDPKPAIAPSVVGRRCPARS